MAMDRAARTFVFTDIEGSTRLWEQTPAAMSSAIRRHDALLGSVMDSHGGHVFKTMGDAFCVAFQDPRAAFDAALEAQLQLHAETWGDTGPIRVRIGVHVGEAELRGEDYFGPTVNRTARLLGVAHGGQILLSEAAASALLPHLPSGVHLRDLGPHRLRDLRRPERIAQVVHPKLPPEFAPLRSLDTLPNNLPLQLTTFVGRDDQLADLIVELRRTRLLTLTGAGGCGKTRMALQVAADALAEFEHGTWLVELAPIQDADLVPRAVAAALDVRPESDRPLLDTLGDFLRERQVLLLLDNCEHLVDACARLAHQLLTRCAALRVLVTSRESLQVEGETLWPVGSLSLPQNGAMSLQEVGAYEAPRLFLDRAHNVAPGLAVGDEDAAAVAQICRRLDGIPLALELAAGRLRTMSLRELSDRLDDRFRVLAGGGRTRLPHHRTLRAAIDWGYDLLLPNERELLRRLSVFVGGWSLEAARDVCGDDAEDLLVRLHDQSLVVVGRDAQETTRYSLLESVRAYVAEKLIEAGEADEYRERHARYFAARVKTQVGGRGLYGADSERLVSSIEIDLDNVRTALDTMDAVPELRATGLQTASTLWVFCWLRGYVPEGRRWLTRHLEGAEEYADANARALGCYAAGILAKESGAYADARELYRRNLALRDELDEAPGPARANTLHALANVVRIEGDLAEARALYEESIRIQTAHGNKSSVAGSLDGLGRVCALQGDDAAAFNYHERGLALFRENGNKVGELIALISVGAAEVRLGRVRQGRRHLHEALRHSRRLQDKQGVASGLGGLASASLAEGRLERARILLK
ncbi:MAG: tetratricopeptide repeat protein, partial [Planctomycetota bacterium]|nr:tetratricopeptide repeat protein [Planctomycetota bacterium]